MTAICMDSVGSGYPELSLLCPAAAVSSCPLFLFDGGDVYKAAKNAQI